jgi:Bacterial mobilisation protein (MobC).
VGRKKKTISRNVKIDFRMTEPEYYVLSKNAEKSGVTVSEYIRKCLTGKKIIINKTDRYTAAELGEIKENLLVIKANFGKIGSNINQIAKYFNQGGYRSIQIVNELDDCLERMQQEMDRIYEITGGYFGNNKTHSSKKQ